MEPYNNLEDLLNESIKKLSKNNILVMKKKKRAE